MVRDFLWKLTQLFKKFLARIGSEQSLLCSGKPVIWSCTEKVGSFHTFTPIYSKTLLCFSLRGQRFSTNTSYEQLVKLIHNRWSVHSILFSLNYSEQYVEGKKDVVCVVSTSSIVEWKFQTINVRQKYCTHTSDWSTLKHDVFLLIKKWIHLK